MSADIHTFPPRKPADEYSRVYHAVLVRDDVSIGELMHALRFTGIVVSTDPSSGQVVIHRSPTPRPAA